MEDTPIHQLRQPLEVHSAVLGESLSLAANEGQADPLREQGRVVYTSSEIVHLQAALALFALDQRIARLRLIHEAKRLFAGTVIAYARDAAPDIRPAAPGPAAGQEIS